MSQTTLNNLRLITPGILILILIVLIVQHSFAELAEFGKSFLSLQLKDSVFIIICLVIGAVYYIFNIRNLLYNPYLKRVQNNIKDTLISPFKIGLKKRQIDYLKEGRKLMHVFYYFVDNDKSLTEKANRVRFNGLIWTDTIDVTIIACAGSILFCSKLLIMECSPYNFSMALILLVIALTSFGLMQLTTKKHISLSDEQLEVICQSHKAELHQKINELLQNRT